MDHRVELQGPEAVLGCVLLRRGTIKIPLAYFVGGWVLLGHANSGGGWVPRLQVFTHLQWKLSTGWVGGSPTNAQFERVGGWSVYTMDGRWPGGRVAKGLGFLVHGSEARQWE